MLINPPLSPVRHTINKKEHQINKDQLNKNVISILEKLKKAGFEAYIVGGGVRDLLLGYKPKDFDIATDAKPEEIRALFKNSRIIGRRFKLLHIYFGREIIEVATFRASPKHSDENNVKSKNFTSHNDEHFTLEGRIIRDNIYGTIDDDIWRRDFTINALYYDAIEETIIDYCNGYHDLKNHCIKILGDPAIRYREDPVRMLRALRFAAKLDFTIEPKTLAPLTNHEYHNMLDSIPSARLFEEYNKLFLTGHSEKSFYLLKQYKLINKLFPYTANHKIEEKFPQHLSFLHQVLQSTDHRIANELPVNPAFLLAAFLWHQLHIEFAKTHSKQHGKEYLWRQAAHHLIKNQNNFLSIPKRFTKVVEEIWYLQRLLMKKKPKAVFKAATHPKFRAGFDFITLRAQVEPINEQQLLWWQDYEASPENIRKQLLEDYEKKFGKS
jgi:poly(A) polymerase